MRYPVYVLAMVLLSGCGGFRGGIESVPYIGGQDPPESSVNHRLPHELRFADLTLQLSLNNAVRTYQYEVMLFVIPTYLDLWDTFERQDAEHFEITLQVTAHESAVVVDPQHILLTIDDEEVRPAGVWVNNPERERQVIETYVLARRLAPVDHPPAVPRSSEWRDAVTVPVMVRPGESSPRFIVTFPVSLPSPERTLSLDLTRSIIAPTLPEKPVIRFKALRWSEGYS
jgi:hypothetical protein